MASDDVKINISVEPILDKRATSNLIRDIKNLEKNFGGIEKDYTKIAKQASSSVAQINRMAKDTALFQKDLSKAASASIEGLKELGGKLQSLRKESAGLEAAYSAEKDEGKKSEIRSKYDALSKSIDHLQKSYKVQKKNTKLYENEIKRTVKNARKNSQALQDLGDYTKKDATKSFGKGLQTMMSGGKANFGAGLKEVLSSVGKGVAGGRARAAERTAGGAAGDSMLSLLPKLAGASAIATGAFAAVSAVYSAIDKASKHIADMNKALLEGSTIAGDWAMTGAQYSGMLKDFRDATVEARSGLMRFGVTSEMSLKTISRFSEQATGSLSETKEMLSRMGGGNLSKGIELFNTNALVYGKALGMETQEVAGFMGNLVSEIGHGSDNVLQTMQSIVKQAATTNMPVTKFMDIFKSAIPNIDLFTNRLEQLTGTMKLLSKTMSPREIQEFMNTMTRGFDQMDFKQRLKMTAVLGVKNVNANLQKDLTNSGRMIAKQFGQKFGQEFQDAMQKDNTVKEVADVITKAQRAGVNLQPAAISAASDAARSMQSAKKGGMLHTATGLRGGSLSMMMTSLEAYAEKFTKGQDLSGLGEHVAKQLGVSENEYKAILKMKDAMAVYTANVEATGRTSSKSINNSLDELIKASGDERGILALKEIMTETPDKFREYLGAAAAAETQNSLDDIKTQEEVASAQYDATTTMSEKIDNIIGYWLEKIYMKMSGVIDVLNDTFDWVSGSKEKAQISRNAARIKDSNRASLANTFGGTFKIKKQQAALASGGTLSPEMEKQFGGVSGQITSRIASGGSIIEGMDPLINAISQLKPEDMKKFGSALGNSGAALANAVGGGVVEGGLTSPELFKKILGSSSDLGQAGLLSDLLMILTSKGIKIDDASIKAKEKAFNTKDQDSLFMSGGAGTSAPTMSGGETQEEILSSTESGTQNLEDLQKSQTDMLKYVKEGSKNVTTMDSGFLKSQYKNVVKDASKEAFSSSLADWLAIQTRMESDSKFKAYIDANPNILTGTNMHDVATSKTEDLSKLPTYAQGGPINYDQVARIHGGEYVVPRGGTLVSDNKGGGSGKSVVINGVTINVTTDASAKDIAAAVNDLYRNH